MGFAMLWVMLFHCFNIHISQPVLYAFKAIGYCGVDIFIVMSGLGQYVSLSKGGTLKDYYFRRFSRILPAYWLVVGVYGLVLRLLERTSLTMVAWNLSTLQYWFGITGGFNWYVPALLMFYLLAPFYVRWLRRCRSGFLLTLCTFPVSYVLSFWALRSGTMAYLADFLLRLPAFAVGCLLGRLLTEERSGEDRALLWGGLGAIGLLVAYVQLKGLYYVSYCYVITAVMVPLCVLLCLILRRLPQIVRRFLRLIGTYSLEIYLINVIVTVEAPNLVGWMGSGGYLVYYPLGFVVTIPLAVGLHKALDEVVPRLERLLRLKIA